MGYCLGQQEVLEGVWQYRYTSSHFARMSAAVVLGAIWVYGCLYISMLCLHKENVWLTFKSHTHKSSPASNFDRSPWGNNH